MTGAICCHPDTGLPSILVGLITQVGVYVLCSNGNEQATLRPGNSAQLMKSTQSKFVFTSAVRGSWIECVFFSVMINPALQLLMIDATLAAIPLRAQCLPS